MEWYKHSKNSIVSWFHGRILLERLNKRLLLFIMNKLLSKKLEFYSQGENQSVRSFYNEILKVCREADP